MITTTITSTIITIIVLAPFARDSQRSKLVMRSGANHQSHNIT